MSNTALFAITAFIWGTTWYGITFQLGDVPKEWSLFYRFILASGILFAVSHFTKRRLMFEVKDHGLFFGLGVLLFCVNYYFSYAGVELLPSGLVAIAFSSMSLMNIINTRIFLKRPIEMPILFASLVGMVGIIILFMPEVESFNLKDTSILGLIITLAGAYTASLGNSLAATKRASGLPVIPTNAWGMLYGSILIAFFAILKGQPITFSTEMPYLLSLIYLSVFGTVIAFTSYLVLIGRIGPERAGYFAILFPVVALAISTIFENYQWTNEAFIGLALVLGGNYVVLKKKEELVHASVKTAK